MQTGIRGRLLPPLLLLLGIAVFLALIVKLCGAQPREALGVMLRGAVGSRVGWGETLARMSVLAFSGLAVAVSFRAGLFNIGAEGQFLVGAAAAALAAKVLPAGVPGVFGVPALLLAGCAAGALWSLAAAELRRRRGVSEVISTLMLNLLAVILVKYLVSYPYLLRDPASILPKSAPFPQGAQLEGWAGTGFHAGVFWVLPAVLALYVLLEHTRWGLSLRASGLNSGAARACGIPVARVQGEVFALAGALAGFGGAMAAMATGHLPADSPYPDYGYMAIAVALVANLHPLAVLPSAFFFALLETGAKSMERSAGVPSEVVYLIEGGVILALLSRGIRLPGSSSARAAAQEAAAPEGGGGGMGEDD